MCDKSAEMLPAKLSSYVYNLYFGRAERKLFFSSLKVNYKYILQVQYELEMNETMT